MIMKGDAFSRSIIIDRTKELVPPSRAFSLFTKLMIITAENKVSKLQSHIIVVLVVSLLDLVLPQTLGSDT